MIRFSAILAVVVAAVGLLVAGAVSGSVLVVYLAIGVAALALLMLIAGVLIWRDEIFGEQAAGRQARAAASQPAVIQPAVIQQDDKQPAAAEPEVAQPAAAEVPMIGLAAQPAAQSQWAETANTAGAAGAAAAARRLRQPRRSGTRRQGASSPQATEHAAGSRSPTRPMPAPSARVLSASRVRPSGSRPPGRGCQPGRGRSARRIGHRA